MCYLILISHFEHHYYLVLIWAGVRIKLTDIRCVARSCAFSVDRVVPGIFYVATAVQVITLWSWEFHKSKKEKQMFNTSNYPIAGASVIKKCCIAWT
jgi:hypothetical protein